MKNCNPQAKIYLQRPDDVVCNRETGRWVLRTSAIGKKIMAGGGPPPAAAFPPPPPAAVKKTKTLDDFTQCNKDVTIKDLQAMLDAHGVAYKKKGLKQYYCDLVEDLIRSRRGRVVGSIKKKTSPAKKSSPAKKKTPSPAKKRTSPAKKSSSAKKKTPSPAKKKTSPAKKSSPAKKKTPSPAGSPAAFTDDVSRMSREEIVRRIKDCLRIR